MRPATVLVAGALCLAALCGVAVRFGVPAIERDLADETLTVLQEAGVAAEVEVSGRDAVVRVDGTLPAAVRAELQDRHDTHLDLRSVRIVEEVPRLATTAAPTTAPPPASSATTTAPATTATTTTTTTAAPTTAAPTTTTTTAAPTTAAPTTVSVPVSEVSVRGALVDGTITLDGTVVSIVEQAALVLMSEQAVGTGQVIDRLVVIPGGDELAGDAQAAALGRMLALFGSGLSPATATVSGNVVTVQGTLSGPDAAAALAAAVEIGVAQGVAVDTTQVTGG